MLLLKLIWFDRAFHNLSELTTSDNLSPGHVLVISHIDFFHIDNCQENNQYFIARCTTLIPPTLYKKERPLSHAITQYELHCLILI